MSDMRKPRKIENATSLNCNHHKKVNLFKNEIISVNTSETKADVHLLLLI